MDSTWGNVNTALSSLYSTILLSDTTKEKEGDGWTIYDGPTTSVQATGMNKEHEERDDTFFDEVKEVQDEAIDRLETGESDRYGFRPTNMSFASDYSGEAIELQTNITMPSEQGSMHYNLRCEEDTDLPSKTSSLQKITQATHNIESQIQNTASTSQDTMTSSEDKRKPSKEILVPNSESAAWQAEQDIFAHAEIDFFQFDISQSMSDCESSKTSSKTSSKASTLKADPFAPRVGKTLSWSKVNMTMMPSGKKKGRKILDNVWGEAPQGELTAIMGPSGAGKSSLLEVLAGRIASRGRIRVEQDLRLDNISVKPRSRRVRKHIAFVAQDDSLQITSTPREAIRFSSKLRLPKSTTEEEHNKLTSRILSELGLKRCADTIIGGGLIKGISGGERKRTSVGVELVVKPSAVFLDEPTSGLDSFSAMQLCLVLKKVARAGASVLLTIHQPASEIFKSFGHLILLNRGQIMYQGPIPRVQSYFAEHGYPIPPNYNPADWIMSVAQAIPFKKLCEKGFFDQNHEIITIDGHKGNSGKCLNIPDGESKAGGSSATDSTEPVSSGIFSDEEELENQPRAGFGMQVWLLLQREARYLYRDKMQLGSRCALSLIISFLIGAVFYGVGDSELDDPSHVQSLFGGYVLVLINAIMGSALPALLTFPVERPVFLREYSTNHYSVLSYFVSRLIVEAFVTFIQVGVSVLICYFMIGMRSSFFYVFIICYALGMSSTALAVTLGASIEDPKLGIEMMPIVFLPQIVLAGFFVTPSLIPSWLRWTRYGWALTYSVNLLLVSEFGDGCGGGMADMYCGMIMKNAEVEQHPVWMNWILSLSLFFGFRLLALAILKKKASKFL